ncbi:hypothetical protein VKT23_020784 [Stygiomarasmius scandens]|uniref:Uncharacterized protein n=1 Tax=Marasmiellus scandens TaxID=2682957 RepID=A0ABR1JDG7_9AGAR
MKIWNDVSPLVRNYLEWRIRNDMTNVVSTCGHKFHSEVFDIGGFFLNQNTGLICAATHTSYSQILPSTFSDTYTTAWQGLALPLHILQTPHDFDIFQHFDSNRIDFHATIASIPTLQYLQATTALPITLGSVMYLESNPDQWNDESLSRPLKIIGQFPNCDPAWSRDHFKPGTLMDNGWTRCTLDQLFESNVISLYNWPRAAICCRENLHKAWLSQAHCYVDMNKKQNYVIADRFTLYLAPKTSFLPQVIPTNLHLFIAPIQILPSPENGTLVDWGENGKTYYWSLDPDGKQRLSDKVSAFLGLPRFQPELRLPSWTDEQYETIFQYQVYKKDMIPVLMTMLVSMAGHFWPSSIPQNQSNWMILILVMSMKTHLMNGKT